MKARHLLLTLALLLTPLWAAAQWESGTTRTVKFYSYTSGKTHHEQTSVTFSIVVPSDGQLAFGSASVGAARVDGFELYGIDDSNKVRMAGSGDETMTVNDVAAGTYTVVVRGRPTDNKGYGGNVVVNYLFTPTALNNDPEPNDEWGKGSLLESGDVQQGHLGFRRGNYTDTEDWYKIVVPDEGTVTLSTTTDRTLRLGSMELCTLKADGTGTNRRNGKDMDGQNKDTTVVFTITDCAAGTYYIRTNRWLGYGSYRLKYTFTPNPNKPDELTNNTWEKPTLLKLDTPTQGRLGYGYYNDTDTEDWYKVEIPEDGKFTITTKTDKTLRLGSLELCTLKADGTGTNRRNGKDMDGHAKDTTIVFEIPDVSAGVYYIRLARWLGYGGYELTCYFTGHSEEADPEPNNSWAEALLLKSGPSVTGQLGYNYQNSLDTEDWYRIEVAKEGAVVLSVSTETTLRLGSMELCTPNAEGTGTDRRNGKDMDGHAMDTTVVFTIPDCAPGTYYVRMTRWQGYGTYTLQYVLNPNVHENDPEPNNSWEQASLIPTDATQEGCLGYGHYNDTDTEDWFKIDVPDEGCVTLSITAETTMRMGSTELCTLKADGTGTNRRNGRDMDGYNKDTTIVFTIPDCAPGTYYLRVTRWQGYGGYKLHYGFTPNADGPDVAGNDSFDKATVVANGATQDGRLGYGYYNDTDTEDWFRLEVPDEGSITLSITAETTLRMGSTELCTLKADGTGTNRRNGKDMDGHNMDTTVVFTIPDCAPGTYYARVSRWQGYGGYKMQYVFTPNVYGPDVAGNDTWEKASVIEAGTTQQARLGYGYYNDTDGEDWFQIDVPYPGDVTVSLRTEPTQRLGSMELRVPKEDGTGTNRRAGKDMDGYNKDTTIVWNIGGLGAGTYYLRQTRWQGYGGYSINYAYVRNPYDKDGSDNSTFANRLTLQEGKTVSTTLGYAYREQNNEDWYDLGMMHGRQIDVTVSPDTTRSLVIGVPALYIYKGDNEDGSPILQMVAQSRLERSQGTISYIDKNTEDQHYVFCVPNYNGNSHGGYTITFGQEEEAGTKRADLANSINVMTSGRNTVRKGVPCENPITITNTSTAKTDKFFLTVTATENIDIIGFRMNSRYGQQFLPIDSVTMPDGAECLHTAVFVVPSLDPWESYTFTMISEGKGDIAYAPRRNIQDGPRRISVPGNTFALVSAVGYVDADSPSSSVDTYISDRVSALFALNEEQRAQFAQVLKELEAKKQQTGMAAFSLRSVLERASLLCQVDVTEATCPIVTGLRHRIYQWIYPENHIIDDIIDVIHAVATITDVVASWDPNEMVGPVGVGDARYIGETQTVNYRILFENKAEAGDAAYRIRISDELDERVFDPTTVRFGETSHDGVGYNWKMTREGNKLSWDISGIELPPNVNAPEGEGYVTFSVDLRPGLASGTQIKNKATIIFDKNYPIETNEYVNTLDILPPVTSKAEVTHSAGDELVTIQCNTTDAGSGVENYLLFVAKNGGEYAYFGQSSSALFYYPVPPEEATYSFYVLAVDGVGNTERVVPDAVSVFTAAKGVRIQNQADASLKVYTPDGRYMGDSLNGLPRGVYVIGGKKFTVR